MIPPKKSKGNGIKGKKTVEESWKTVNVSKESEPEPKPAKKKTTSKRVVKKKVTLSANDNIISDDPNVSLELAKSINKTKAQEAEAARKVHATHARIVTESVSEFAKKNSSGRSSKIIVIQDTLSALKSKLSTSKTKTKGAPFLTLEEQEVEDISQALKERVPDESTFVFTTSSEGNGVKPGVLDEDKDITEEKVILEWGDEQDSEFFDDGNNGDEKDDKDGDADDKGDDHISDTQDADDEDDKTESDEDEIYKYKIRVHNEEDVEIKYVEVEESDKGEEKMQMLVHYWIFPFNTKLPDPSCKNKKDVAELKTVDHSYEALAALQPYVPTVVDSYLGTKVKDVFQKELQKHTAYLIPKYYLLHLPVLTKKPTTTTKQESEKSHSEIIKIKQEQAEIQKNPQYTIKSTNKAALEDYDLKSALYQSMHANKKHDHDENNDDEDPPAGQNQGKKTKRRTTKESISSKKPSSTKETTKGKASTKGSKTGKSTSTKEPVEEPIAEVIMDDVGKDVFKQPPRPATPDPKWNKRQVVIDQPLQPWFNQMVSASKDPLPFNDLMATPINFSKYVLNGLKIDHLTQDILLGPAFNLLKGTCSSSIELEYNFQECFNALTNNLDWKNLEGDRYPFDLFKPLPLQGPPHHRTVAADYFFNNDLEYMKTSDPKVTYTTSITKTKVARYEIKGIKDMVLEYHQACVSKFSKQYVYSTKAILGVKSVSVNKFHGYGHLEEIMVKRFDQQLYKFKEGDFVDLHLNDIEDMLLLAVQDKLFHLDGSDIVGFIVALRMFTRSLILKIRVEDIQLGVGSYQKKLNISKPQKTFPEIKFKEPYTPLYYPPGIFYEDLDKHNRVLRADELYKFSNGTLKSVHDEIHHRVLYFRLDYNPRCQRGSGRLLIVRD
uniref:Uncharacterized protein n=1 Tax=Tanacetum cinerariifolium TaxID=118510 RepID=A0A6L2MCP5_TANCI|nr:hypothetical protein [Tanacetum cinerariifolium]